MLAPNPSQRLTRITVIFASTGSVRNGILAEIQPISRRNWFSGPNCPLKILRNTRRQIIPGMAHGRIMIVRNTFLNFTHSLFKMTAWSIPKQ